MRSPKSWDEWHWFDDAAPFKIDGNYCKLIPLTKGQYAVVWKQDYASLMQWRWCARWDKEANKFYAVRRTSINGKAFTIPMHRQICGLSPEDKLQVDHIEPSLTLVNTRTNLRIATGSQNSMNTRAHRDSSTGLKGIFEDRRDGTFTAMIMVNGKRYYLGRRRTAEEAYKLRCDMAPLFHGKFTRNK